MIYHIDFSTETVKVRSADSIASMANTSKNRLSAVGTAKVTK